MKGGEQAGVVLNAENRELKKSPFSDWLWRRSHSASSEAAAPTKESTVACTSSAPRGPVPAISNKTQRGSPPRERIDESSREAMKIRVELWPLNSSCCPDPSFARLVSPQEFATIVYVASPIKRSIEMSDRSNIRGAFCEQRAKVVLFVSVLLGRGALMDPQPWLGLRGQSRAIK